MSITESLPLVPLTELAEVNPSRMAVKLTSSDEVTFIPMGDVSESGRWTGQQTRLMAEVRNGFTCFAEGDVLFAKITPCMENGKGCVARGLTNLVGFGSTEFHVLRSKDHSDSGYIYQWTIFQDLRKAAKNSMTGSAGQQRVPSDFFEKFQVPAFAKPEQTKIADILSTVDRAIEQTESLMAKQQRLKTGLMQDLLSRGIDEHGRIRSEETHEFKDSPLGRIPVEWEVTPAKELCDAVIDCKNRTPPAASEGHPVIRTPNVRGGEFVYRDLAWTDADSYNLWVSRGKPRPGDVVITREAPFGEACQIPLDMPAACLGQRMMMYQTNAEKLRPDFLVLAIHSEAVQTRLLEMAGGSTVGHIRVGDIRSLSIPHPVSVEEQEKISQTLSGAGGALKDLGAQKCKLSSLKTALMQDLLSGRKRVTDLLDRKEATQ